MVLTPDVRCGSIPGLAIDAISGGLYTLNQNDVRARLARQGALVDPSSDGLYVGVVLHHDSHWQLVDSLRREAVVNRG